MNEEERNEAVQAADDAYVEAMKAPRAEWLAARDAAQAEYNEATKDVNFEIGTLEYEEATKDAQAAYDAAVSAAKMVLRVQDMLASETRLSVTKAAWTQYNLANGVTE